MIIISNKVTDKVSKFLQNLDDDKQLTKDELSKSLELAIKMVQDINDDKGKILEYANVIMGLTAKMKQDGNRKDIDEELSSKSEKLNDEVLKMEKKFEKESIEGKEEQVEGIIRTIKGNLSGYINENYSAIALSEDYIDLQKDFRIGRKLNYDTDPETINSLIDLSNKYQNTLGLSSAEQVKKESELMIEFLTDGDSNLRQLLVMESDDDDDDFDDYEDDTPEAKKEEKKKEIEQEKGIKKRVMDVLTFVKKAISMKDDDIEETMKFRYKAFRMLFSIALLAGAYKFLPASSMKTFFVKLLVISGSVSYAMKYNKRSLDLVNNKIEVLEEKISEEYDKDVKYNLMKTKSSLERTKTTLEKSIANSDNLKAGKNKLVGATKKGGSSDGGYDY